MLDLARVVDAERRCGGSLSFAIEITPASSLWFSSVTGPQEAQEIIAELTAGTRSPDTSDSQ